MGQPRVSCHIPTVAPVNHRRSCWRVNCDKMDVELCVREQVQYAGSDSPCEAAIKLLLAFGPVACGAGTCHL